MVPLSLAKVLRVTASAPLEPPVTVPAIERVAMRLGVYSLFYEPLNMRWFTGFHFFVGRSFQPIELPHVYIHEIANLPWLSSI